MDKRIRKSWIVIAVTLAATAIFGAMVPRIILDNEVKAFFPYDHPSYVRVRNLDDTYGSQILMDIAIEAKRGTILTADAVRTIGDITADLEALDHIERIQSLTNMDYIAAIDGGMSAERLVPEGFAGTPEELEGLRQRIVDWEEMYGRVVVSDSFKGSQIIINVDHDITAPQMSELYKAASAIVAKYKNDNLTVRLAGDPVLSERAKEYMQTDLAALIPLVSLVVLVILFLSFGNLEGTLLPLITVVISTVWTVGLMALTGTHFTIVSSTLPVLLIAVGSAYGIHVVNHYYEDLRSVAGELTAEAHRDLITRSVKKMVAPVALAGITTIAGFISTVTSPIVPLKTFAIFSAVGVTIALVLSLVLIPALLTVKPIKSVNRQIAPKAAKKGRFGAGAAVSGAASGNPADAPDEPGWKDTAVGQIYGYLNKRRGRVVIALAAIIGLSFWGLARLNVESSLIEYFPKESEMRRDAAAIDDQFAGTNLFSFVITGQEKGDLADPAILKEMDGLSAYLLERHPEIGKIVSFSDFIKRMNKVMHAAPAEAAAAGGADGFADFATGADFASGAEVSSFFGDDAASSSGDDFSSFFGDDASAGGASTAAAESPVSASDAAMSANTETLESTPNVAEVIGLFNRAYARAGGGNISAGELLAALEEELNYGGAAYNEIPSDASKYPVASEGELKNLVSQYLLLYSGSLDQFADDPLAPKAARMQVQLRTHKTTAVADVIADARRYAEANFPEGYSIEATGIAEMEVALTDMITGSQLSSLALAIAVVFIILAIYFKSPVAGLIGSIPLSLSILINFGIMGLTGINLDMITSLIGSIAIGIGVDYTIHFMNNYHTERLKSENLDEVTMNTLKVSGKAIVVNAVSVGLGFLVLCLSQFVVLRYIGFLVAVVMLTSSVTAMTVLPVILNVFKPKFISKPL